MKFEKNYETTFTFLFGEINNTSFYVIKFLFCRLSDKWDTTDKCNLKDFNRNNCYEAYTYNYFYDENNIFQCWGGDNCLDLIN